MHSNYILGFSAVDKAFVCCKSNYNSGTHILSDVFVGFWDVHCKRTSSGEESQVALNTKVCNILLHLGINA